MVIYAHRSLKFTALFSSHSNNKRKEQHTPKLYVGSSVGRNGTSSQLPVRIFFGMACLLIPCQG